MIDSGDSLLILAWSLVGVSAIVVSLRFWVRIFRVHYVKADDWCMLIAVLTEITHTILLTIAHRFGLGQHMATLSSQNTVQALKYITIQEGPSCMTPMWGRISFAIFLSFILGATARNKTIILRSIIAVQVVINIVVVIQIYTQCGTHPTALWSLNPTVKAHCQSPEVETMLGFVQSALNSLSDLTLTVIPAVIVWNLNLPLRRKMAVAALLMLSTFALAASIVKAIEIKNLSFRNDFTWNMVSLQLWAVTENNIVIIAASIPTLRPLLRKTQRFYPSYYPQYSHIVVPPRHVPADGAGEEHMLGSVEPCRIMKKTTVQVVYESTATEREDGAKAADAAEPEGAPVVSPLRVSRSPPKFTTE